MEARGISTCITRTLHTLHLFCILSVTSSFLFGPDNIGELKPDNPRVFFEDQLVLKCSLFNTEKYNSSHLYFTYRQDLHVPPESVTIESDKVAILNETVTNMADFSEVMYNCWAGKELISSQLVVVEYRSRPVRDFHCVVHNWDNMVCDWKLGDYKSLKNVNVTVSWTATGLSGWYICKNLTKTSCFWNESELSTITQFLINVTVTVNMDEPSVASSVFNITANTLVKPSKVNNLVAATQSSTCVSLKWHHTQVARGLVHRVNYTDGAVLVTAAADIRLQNYTVCDLSPFTNYVFFVESRPLVHGFWSDAAEVSNKTIDDVPAVGPNITSGSYMYKEESCVNGSRNVILFFKAPKKEHQNGILTKYKLHITNRKTNQMYSRKIDADETTAHLELKCKTIYEVQIFAMTRLGPSKKCSHISVDTHAAVKRPRQFRIESDRDLQAVFAKWDAPQHDESTTKVTIYWCKGSKASPNICKNGYDWKEAEENSMVRLPVDLEDVDTHMFAISRDTPAGSSGMEWSQCSYISNQRPDVPGDIRVAKKNPDLALNILWNGKWCDSTSKSLLSKYNIIYNPVGSSEPNKTVSVDRFASNYQLNDLQKVNYSIWMQAQSDGGKLGPISKPVFGIPADNRLSVGEITGIVFGSLFALFFIAAGIFFLCRNCKKGCKRDKITFPSYTKNLQKDFNANGVVSAILPGDSNLTIAGDSNLTIPSTEKSRKGPDTGLIIDRQMSTVSTDSGRGSMHDNNKNGGMSPLSITSNCFQTLKEEDEVEKVKNESGSTANTRPPDYSRFANIEESNSLPPATVGLVLGHTNPKLSHRSVSRNGSSLAAEGKVSGPLTGNSVESYVTVGGADNNEVQFVDQNSGSCVPGPPVSNSVEAYVTVGGTDNNEVQFVDQNKCFFVPVMNNEDYVDNEFGGTPSKIQQEFVKDAESSSGECTETLTVHNMDASSVLNTDRHQNEHPAIAESRDPALLQNLLSSNAVNRDLPSGEKTDPPYVDSEFSPVVENTDRSDVQNPASNGMTRTDPPYVDSIVSPGLENTDKSNAQNPASNGMLKTDPPYVQSTDQQGVLPTYPSELQNHHLPNAHNNDSPYIQNTEPPYVQNTEPPYVQNMEPSYVQNTEPPYVQNTEPPYVQNTEPSYVQNTEPSYVQNTEPPYVQNTEPPYVQNTEPPYVQNTEPPYVQNTEPPYVQNMESPFVQNTEPPYVQNMESPYVQNTEPPYVQNTESPYVQNTESPYVQNMESPYVQNTESPYVQNTEPPYVQNTESPYVQNTEPSSVQNTDSPYVQNTEPPYIQNTDSPHVQNANSQMTVTSTENSSFI